jgi:hypothetical protein
MVQKWSGLVFIFLLGGMLAACNNQKSESAPEGNLLDATPSPVSIDTVEATSTEQGPPTLPPTATIPSSPPPTVTATPEPVSLTVSANTHCRQGQGIYHELSGTLLTGEEVEVIARSTVPDYWYIENPANPDEFCWLWGEYATLVGEVDALPVLTPFPSPTPGPLVAIDYAGTINCDRKYAFFVVRNYGPFTFMTAERTILDLDTGKTVYPTTFDRHPFAPLYNNCVPGHENEVYPGDVAYIYVPLQGSRQGHRAQAIIRVCTEDYLQGLCHTQWINFRFP